MWTGRIALLSMLLLLCGGWFDALLPKWKKRAALLLLPVVFALSFVPTLREPCVRLCAAPCALALLAALLCPTEQPLRAAFSAVLGGVIGWRLCETLPLFFEQGLLIAVPTLLVSMLYCRDPNARALALAAAPFFMLLCRAGADYTLFKSAVLELGNEDALTAQAVGILLLLAATAAVRALRDGRIRIGKGIARRETT